MASVRAGPQAVAMTEASTLQYLNSPAAGAPRDRHVVKSSGAGAPAAHPRAPGRVRRWRHGKPAGPAGRPRRHPQCRPCSGGNAYPRR